MKNQGPQALNLSWRFERSWPLESPKNLVLSIHHFIQKAGESNMFFWGIPPPDVNAGEDEFRREFARTLRCQDWVDMFVVVIMCDWYWLVMCAGKMTCSSVCVLVYQYHVLIFSSIMYSLMFIVFGPWFKLKRFWTGRLESPKKSFHSYFRQTLWS